MMKIGIEPTASKVEGRRTNHCAQPLHRHTNVNIKIKSAMAFKRFYFTLQYADYWTKRFPRLLIHAWYTMHCVKREPAFIKYFDKDFDFVQVKPATITVVVKLTSAPLKL